MENNQSNTKRTKGLIICGVLLLSAVSASWMLSERPLNNHECFVSITAREMLESGDWTLAYLQRRASSSENASILLACGRFSQNNRQG